LNFGDKPPILPFSQMVAGVGIDLVMVGRLEAALRRWGERLAGRIFTQRERREAEQGGQSMASLAARFAAKEAFLKALGMGLFQVPFREVEVLREPSGRPVVHLHGKAKEICQGQGVRKVHISLSHDGGMAVAVVILEV